MVKRTKIVCTIGPSSESVEQIQKMVDAGMNVARLNFSHGSYENHSKLIENIRTVTEQSGHPVTIMQDLQGPKIRIGEMPEEGIVLEQGASITFDTALDTYTSEIIPIGYKVLHEYVQPGERLLLNDGKMEVSITHVEGSKITGEVIVGGTLTSHKGINIPDTALTVSALTEKDRKDVKFGVEQGVDMIALSFVMNAKDILDLRYLIKQYEEELAIDPVQPINIIAKIERAEAVNHIDEILDVVDAIMVARGDLGIEIPAAEVPLVQKTLIDKALDNAKPVIVATQMLDSMQHNPRPTRAEVSDVANAVIDHTDAVMLSNETAAGEYPVETVQTMADIIIKTESSKFDNLEPRAIEGDRHPVDDVVSQLSRALAEQVHAKLILAASISGETARLISRNRPELPIVVATSDVRTQHQMNLSWGVIPFILEPCNTIEELVERSMVYLKKDSLVAEGDKIIIVAGEPVGQAGHVNLLEVRDVV